MLHPSQSLGTCRTTAPEKLVAQLTKCMPGALVLVYPAICGRDAWRRPEPRSTTLATPRRKADTTYGVLRNVAWSIPKRTRHYVAVFATCACHVSWTRRPAHLLSRTSSLSLLCPSVHLLHVDSISPVPAMSPVQAWTPHEGQLLRTSLLSVCCTDRTKIFEGCVDAILHYGDVTFTRIWRGHHHLHSCEM